MSLAFTCWYFNFDFETKQMTMEKKVGIWVDKRKAFMVTIIGDQLTTNELASNIETFNPKGGARSKTAYGSMDTVNEKAYLKKEISQTQQFFKRLLREVGQPKHLYLFGPAQMKNELEKYLLRHLHPVPVSVVIETADSMTDNQMIAKVRDAFQVLS